ncbi:uncharacterized protein LOC112592488 [Melanaphis sacchari]|uniref:uncharacterized protein LOC112592488 n=1 Tax=Melanaphis sacchari TaxID=742174 RepID=UPI000DC13D77|nr:uncharacterized protein LOC112592488 [Melanaphis sacchari]
MNFCNEKQLLKTIKRGSYDLYGHFCPNTSMKISLLPSNCTSFVYEVLNFNVEVNTTISTDDKHFHINLSKLPQDGNFDETFYKNLTNYVTVLKTSSVFSEVGLFMNASDMIYHRNNSKAPGWLDYDKWLNNIMDYYIISFDKFNPCNNQFKTGIVPLDNSDAQTNNTLMKFQNVLNDSKMAEDKIYLEFSLSPTVNDTNTETLPTCYVTYKKLCELGNYTFYWCADNADALFSKGKFARDIKAKGIVAKYIDTSDPTGNCGCDNQNQFITYSMIFRGFLNQTPFTDCEKFNNATIQLVNIILHFNPL